MIARVILKKAVIFQKPCQPPASVASLVILAIATGPPRLSLMEMSPENIFPIPFMIPKNVRSEEHTSELQSRGHLVCRLLLEKKNTNKTTESPKYPLHAWN